jgi:hypothetical protein
MSGKFPFGNISLFGARTEMKFTDREIWIGQTLVCTATRISRAWRAVYRVKAACYPQSIQSHIGATEAEKDE